MTADTLQIEIQQTNNSRLQEVDFNNLVFGRNIADHMFIAEYRDGQWQNSRIVPYGDLSLSPATAALHYGQAIFEGMKAYKSEEGERFFSVRLITGNVSTNLRNVCVCQLFLRKFSWAA